MASSAALAHVISRMRADIDFLVTQGVISPTDGHTMSAKLPSSQSPYTMPTPILASASPTPAVASARRVVPPPPPHQPSQVSQARSLWPYNENGQETDDLTFGAGEVIEILEETNADWWKGKNSRGETGLFPSNYVERVAAAPTSALPAVQRMVPPIYNEKATYDSIPVAPPAPQSQEQQPAQPKKSKFGKYGNTMAQSAAGGVGFGAGAAIGSGIVNAIF